MKRKKQIHGLRALITEAVDQGSAAVERVQLAVFERPIAILEKVPPLAEPAQLVREVHNIWVSGVHGIIRFVNHGVGMAAEKVIDAASEDSVDPPES